MFVSNLRKVSFFLINNMLRSKINRAVDSTHSSSDGNFNNPKRLRPSDSTRDLLDLSAEGCEAADKSKYFPNLDTPSSAPSIEQQFLNIQLEFNAELKNLKFKSPVSFVYNPLEYAFQPNEIYVRKYCTNQKKLLFLGMNPGPFGMCQTGVPFGEIKSVRDWLEVEAEVGKPETECPKRPILGFQCTKTEVSGDRLWNLLKKLFVTPQNFFATAFLYNYCPLAFMKSDGCNLTPRDLKDPRELEEVCDKYYLKVIELLKPEIIIGIGEYIEKRTIAVLKQNTIDNIKVLRLPHPSPRAINNQNWPEKGEKFFETNDLLKYFKTQ